MTALVVAHGATVDGGDPNCSDGIRACAERGIRWIEVDVRTLAGLAILGHDAPSDGATAEPLTAVLDLFSSFGWVMLDLKEPDVAGVAADAVVQDAVENVVFASTHARDLKVVRSVMPSARLSYSFPQDVPTVSQNPRWSWVVTSFLAICRLIMPIMLVYWTSRHRPSQFTLHWKTVSRFAFRTARALDRPVFVWTVDNPADAARLIRDGAAGVITNRPLAVASRVSSSGAG